MPAIVAAAAIAAAGTVGSSVYAARSGARGARQAADAQTRAANYGADLEAKAAEQALVFAKEQEAARQREWQAAQDRNRAIYDTEQAREQGRYDDLQARLAPYRRFGRNAIGQMGRPIPGSPIPGSLGARIGA